MMRPPLPWAIICLAAYWVAKNTPPGIRARVRVPNSSPGLVVNPDHPAIAAASAAFEEVIFCCFSAGDLRHYQALLRPRA